MFDFITQSSAFLTILGTGLAYIITLGFLGSFGGDHDADTDHDNDSGHDTVSVFSPKIIAIFMVGFGAAGAIATHHDFGVTGATLFGLGGGAVLGAIAVAGLRLLHGQQASSEIVISDAINLTGNVTIDLPTVGFGEVSVVVKGQYLTYSASSRGTFIPRNTLVKVVAVEGTYLIVQSILS